MWAFANPVLRIVHSSISKSEIQTTVFFGLGKGHECVSYFVDIGTHHSKLMRGGPLPIRWSMDEWSFPPHWKNLMSFRANFVIYYFWFTYCRRLYDDQSLSYNRGRLGHGNHGHSFFWRLRPRSVVEGILGAKHVHSQVSLGRALTHPPSSYTLKKWVSFSQYFAQNWLLFIFTYVSDHRNILRHRWASCELWRPVLGYHQRPLCPPGGWKAHMF